MGGGKAEADWARFCHTAWGFSGKPLRRIVLIRIAIDVADEAVVEGLLQRRLGGEGLELDYVVARDRSGMQQHAHDRNPADVSP